MPERSLRKADEIRRLVSTFINRESNRESLITVTRVLLSSDMKKARICCSVFPETKEKAALDFLKRNRKEMSAFLRTEGKIGRLPRLDFVLDQGEVNRRRIDELLKEG